MPDHRAKLLQKRGGLAALYAPAGTPQEIVRRLSNEVDRALKSPAVADRLRDLGAVPAGGSAERLAAYQRAEQEKWIQAGKIKPD